MCVCVCVSVVAIQMAAKKQHLNRILLKSLVKSFFYIEIKVVTIFRPRLAWQFCCCLLLLLLLTVRLCGNGNWLNSAEIKHTKCSSMAAATATAMVETKANQKFRGQRSETKYTKYKIY